MNEQITQQQAATPWMPDSWWDELEQKPLVEQVAILQAISRGLREPVPLGPHEYPLTAYSEAVDRARGPLLKHPRFIAWALKNQEYILNPTKELP